MCILWSFREYIRYCGRKLLGFNQNLILPGTPGFPFGAQPPSSGSFELFSSVASKPTGVERLDPQRWGIRTPAVGVWTPSSGASGPPAVVSHCRPAVERKGPLPWSIRTLQLWGVRAPQLRGFRVRALSCGVSGPPAGCLIKAPQLWGVNAFRLYHTPPGG